MRSDRKPPVSRSGIGRQKQMNPFSVDLKGALENPYHHQKLSIAASPAPPKIAQQIYVEATQTKMCLRYAQGEPMEKTLAWAEGECEGYMRS